MECVPTKSKDIKIPPPTWWVRGHPERGHLLHLLDPVDPDVPLHKVLGRGARFLSRRLLRRLLRSNPKGFTLTTPTVWDEEKDSEGWALWDQKPNPDTSSWGVWDDVTFTPVSFRKLLELYDSYLSNARDAPHWMDGFGFDDMKPLDVRHPKFVKRVKKGVWLYSRPVWGYGPYIIDLTLATPRNSGYDVNDLPFVKSDYSKMMTWTQCRLKKKRSTSACNACP